MPHLVFDVRSSEEIQNQPLPRDISFSTLHLPLDEIDSALSGNISKS